MTSAGQHGPRFVLITEDRGAEMHRQRGNSSLRHPIAFDWLDKILAP